MPFADMGVAMVCIMCTQSC